MSIAGRRAGEGDPLAPKRPSSPPTIRTNPPPGGSRGSAPEFHHEPPRRRATMARRASAARVSNAELSQPRVATGRPGARMSTAAREPVVGAALALGSRTAPLDNGAGL